MTRSGGGYSGDENLEIVFWWLGDDPKASIEDDLEDFLVEDRPRRPRPRSWRFRRAHLPA